MIFSSSINIQPTVTACPSENVRSSVHTASLRSARHPVNFFHCQLVSPSKHLRQKDGLSSTSCFVITDATLAAFRFATIWAYAFAVINGITASFTNRLLFFQIHILFPLSIIFLEKLNFLQKKKNVDFKKSLLLKCLQFFTLNLQATS